VQRRRVRRARSSLGMCTPHYDRRRRQSRPR
jgi:hypothetical protein